MVDCEDSAVESISDQVAQNIQGLEDYRDNLDLNKLGVLVVSRLRAEPIVTVPKGFPDNLFDEDPCDIEYVPFSAIEWGDPVLNYNIFGLLGKQLGWINSDLEFPRLKFTMKKPERGLRAVIDVCKVFGKAQEVIESTFGKFGLSVYGLPKQDSIKEKLKDESNRERVNYLVDVAKENGYSINPFFMKLVLSKTAFFSAHEMLEPYQDNIRPTYRLPNGVVVREYEAKGIFTTTEAHPEKLTVTGGIGLGAYWDSIGMGIQYPPGEYLEAIDFMGSRRAVRKHVAGKVSEFGFDIDPEDVEVRVILEPGVAERIA